jgi:large subunit ribosomal protein L18
MKRLQIKQRQAEGRKARVRKKIGGTAARPRVSVFFSNKNVVAQLVDDVAGKTLAAVTTLSADAAHKGSGRDAAKWVGAALADKAKELGVEEAVFDRGSRRYHGKVKDLAEALREKGLKL